MNRKQNADGRIIRHRTSDLDIVVLNGRGEPIPGARVELGIQRHGFGFGTAVNAEYLLDSGEGSPYCRLIPKLFNNAVFENRHKWGFWDTIHWHESVPRFRADWSEKTAFSVYTDLVFGQWWTEESSQTNEEGIYSTHAFLDEYELMARTEESEATIADATEPTTIPIRVDRTA